MAQFILPDLQACLLCEDVRQEASGQHTLVGILGVIPAPMVPIGFLNFVFGRVGAEARAYSRSNPRF